MRRHWAFWGFESGILHAQANKGYITPMSVDTPASGQATTQFSECLQQVGSCSGFTCVHKGHKRPRDHHFLISYEGNIVQIMWYIIRSEVVFPLLSSPVHGVCNMWIPPAVSAQPAEAGSYIWW